MSNERVLIVEDEKIIALDLQRRLERFGYLVIDMASDGEDAVQKAKDLRPDIILMDIMLSGETDGIEAAKIIKTDLRIPVIFLTAYADEKTLERAKEAEPFGYILKPFKERELYTTIDIAIYKNNVDKQLRKQERLFSAILHSVNDGLIAIDTNEKVLFLNPVAEQLTGWKEEDAKGQAVETVFGILDPRSQRPLLPEALPAGQHPILFREAVLRNALHQTYFIDGSVTKIHELENETEGYVLAFRDVSEIKRMSATIDYQASHDSLTGLSNREEFSLRLAELIDEMKRQGGVHTLMELDVDRFKVVNDTCGTMAGDELLRQVASITQSLTQRNDISARFGGDEFAVILRSCTLDDAMQVAQRLQNAVQTHRFVWQKNLFPITLSIGIVPLTSEVEDVHAVLASADDACNLAKEEGGNRIRVFESAGEKYIQRRGLMEWISKINRALENDTFQLYFQSIEPLSNNRELKTKVEILLRLRLDDGTIVSPGVFIPSAERYGIMTSIDRWVVQRSFRAWRELRDKHHPITESIFSINLSGPTLLDEAFVDFIIDCLEETEIPAPMFCFEITETSAIQNLSYASRFMTRLKDLGFTFALDDFGSGFSSFSYLKSLPVDFLKIDGSIVQNIDESKVNYTMVESINSMGHVLGLQTIAEYARDQAVLDKLTAIGVDFAQGYALSEPRPLP